MLEDLLTVSLKQQGGHTQAVGVKAFELVIEAVDLCLMKTTRGRYWRRRLIWTYLIYLSDIKLLQTIQERCKNGRHLRLQSMTCDMRQGVMRHRGAWETGFLKHTRQCVCLHPLELCKGERSCIYSETSNKRRKYQCNIGITLQLPSDCTGRDDKSEGFQREVGLTRRYPSSSRALSDLFLIGRIKVPVDKWKWGARANGMVINHTKEVMGNVTET